MMRNRTATKPSPDLTGIDDHAAAYRAEELDKAGPYRAPEHFADRPGPYDGEARAEVDRLARMEATLARVEEGLANANAITVFEATLETRNVEVAADARIAVLLVAAWTREAARSTKTPNGEAVLRVLELEHKAQLLEARVCPVTDDDRVAVEALREAVGE